MHILVFFKLNNGIYKVYKVFIFKPFRYVLARIDVKTAHRVNIVLNALQIISCHVHVNFCMILDVFQRIKILFWEVLNFVDDYKTFAANVLLFIFEVYFIHFADFFCETVEKIEWQLLFSANCVIKRIYCSNYDSSVVLKLKYILFSARNNVFNLAVNFFTRFCF